MNPVDPFSAEALATISAREQRTVIGHSSIDLMSPVSDRTLEDLLSCIPVGPRLLDIGCGKSALARHVLRKDSAASAVGVERNPVLAAQGAALAKAEGLSERLEVVLADGREWRASEPFDAIALLGATHVLGTLPDVLSYGCRNLKAGGVLLLGEGIWTARPHPEYLAFLGADEDELMTMAAIEQEVGNAGFQIQYRHQSGADEWDAYEEPYFRSLREYTDASGGHPFAEEADAFEAMQMRHGRGCMGFVVMAVVPEPSRVS